MKNLLYNYYCIWLALTCLLSRVYHVVVYAEAVALHNKMLCLVNNHQKPVSDIRWDQLRLHRDYHIDKQLLDHILHSHWVDSQIGQPYRNWDEDCNLRILYIHKQKVMRNKGQREIIIWHVLINV